MRIIKKKTKYYTYDWKTNKDIEISEEAYIKILKIYGDTND